MALGKFLEVLGAQTVQLLARKIAKPDRDGCFMNNAIRETIIGNLSQITRISDITARAMDLVYGLNG